MSTGLWIWIALAAGSGGSLMIGRPWTMLLSRGRYLEQIRAHQLFREANWLITGAWTLYFAAAASTTALTMWWISILFTVPTPLLGWLSFVVGDRYAPWKLRRSEPKRKGDAPMSTPAQAELRSLIVDKTDDEILAAMSQAPGGIAGLLDQTVAEMSDTLDPARAQNCVIGYEIDAGDVTLAYRIEVRGADVCGKRLVPSDARVVMRLSAPDYLRLITGLLDGTEAFMAGRMKISGDVMFAPQVGRMFHTA
jgi:putative sterol carrier protein